MGMYKYINKLWKKPQTNMPELWRERLLKWRREPSTIRIERPTRIDRARSLGYKAKQGFIVVRQRVLKGGHRRPRIKGGRRSKHFRQRMNLDKAYKQIAEERANKKYPNCDVLNSYLVMRDGKYYWFEVILADREQVSKYKGMEWLARGKHRGRVFRGKTSEGKRGRGILTHKGKGAEKLRPSLRAKKRLAK